MEEDRREGCRADYPSPVEFTVSLHEHLGTRRIDNRGSIINLSHGGLSMKTELALEPGHILILTNGVRRPAIVRWSHPVDSGYHVGIQFI